MEIEDSDEALLGRIKNGDKLAFSLLLRRHNERFYRLAWRMCGNNEDAEDIIQNAFLKLWHKPQLFDSHKGAKFTTWFYRIVVNMSLDQKKKANRLQYADDVDQYEDTTATATETLFNNQRQAQLEAAIQNLPDRQKIALNLCFYEELSNAEAAEIMNVKIKALESLLMRAKQKIKDTLKTQGLLDHG